MAQHSVRRPGFLRRHRRASLAVAGTAAVLTAAGTAYAINADPGQRVTVGTVTDSGQYGVYKNGSTVPAAAIWVHNYGTHCTDEGREELTALLYLNPDTCQVIVEPGPGEGGDYTMAIDPRTATPADTPGTATTMMPSTTPTTAATTTTTTAATNTGCNFAFAQTTKSVTGPCTVSGDVMVSSATSWTDNDDTTGHGFVIPAGTTVDVHAPWGAYADPRPASEVVKSMVTLGGGCADKAPADGVLDGCRVATILNLDGTVAATATMSTTGTTAATTTSTAATGSTTTTTGTGATTTTTGSNSSTSSTTGSTTTTAATCGAESSGTYPASTASVTVPANTFVDGDITYNGQDIIGKRVKVTTQVSIVAKFGASWVKVGCEGPRDVQVVTIP